MPRMRLLWRIYPPFLFILLGALAGLMLYNGVTLATLQRQQVRAHLEDLAKVAAREMARASRSQDFDADALAKDLGRASSARITLLSNTGTVLGDSQLNPVHMDNHRDRKEIREALEGRPGRAERFSYSTRQQTMYVAVPVLQDGKVLGVVRAGLPVRSAAGLVRPVYLRELAGTLLIALVAAGLCLLAVRRVARQMEQVQAGIERYADGDLSVRLPVSDTLEMGAMAAAVNRMGGQFEDRMQAILRQRNELEAVLSSMVEGVIAVDSDERVISLNAAAARMFHVTRDDAIGRSIQELIRNTDLQRFVACTLASREPLEGDVILQQNGERTLHARGTVLRDGQGRGIGGLVVLNDVTRLRRLETARRDFVANVSHELRTPITSIKGYAETLLDGAIDQPEDARRFAEIIQQHADRLNALIGDLLTLARIERDAEAGDVVREEAGVRDILDGAVQACESQAAAKGIRVEVRCEPSLTAQMSPNLVEQAVVNLLDNAVKFSETNGAVEVEAEAEGDEIVIRVRDRGCGIGQEHLPRIFERFYRVDKARSRKQGGTGLGLAIVKHIVRLHGGRTAVESAPGRGSTFTLYLPRT